MGAAGSQWLWKTDQSSVTQTMCPPNLGLGDFSNELKQATWVREAHFHYDSMGSAQKVATCPTKFSRICNYRGPNLVKSCWRTGEGGCLQPGGFAQRVFSSEPQADDQESRFSLGPLLATHPQTHLLWYPKCTLAPSHQASGSFLSFLSFFLSVLPNSCGF